ncbi:MAG TPA: ABC transporter permease, partial [Phototrophicaceae bacterium]|nr:ABC transporter permease [Phototrophicaceae bacterium]
LFALGLALVTLRVFPFVLRLIGNLINVTTSVALLMALRELTRSIGRYRGALLMMAFTLSLTGFTASMASTLDRSLSDSIDYKVGADLVIVTAADAQTTTNDDGSYTVTGYNTPPVEELAKIDGVEAVSRVGRYTGRLKVGSQVLDGTLIGVDRYALAAVTLFRSDYSDQPLADLMNKLAGDRTGIILNRQIADQYKLVEGQEVTIGIYALETWYESRVRVLGFVDYFPTMDPSKGFFVVTNIDPLHELAGTTLPYDAWLSLKPGADVTAVAEAVRAIGYPALRFEEPTTELAAARAEPVRRGVLGFLSVGFIAAIGLTLIAAIIQSTASFRAQSQQLGALRAMGLGRNSVSGYLLLVQSLSAFGGIAGGTAIGVATTLLFLPLLDFSGGLPPYLVRVSWSEITIVYAVFAGVLFSVTLLTTIVLSREQLATVVRLGEG